MIHVKSSWSAVAAVASVLGIAACGGQQQPQPNTANSAQDQSPELYGSRAPAETQGTTMRQGEENASGLPSTAPTTTSNPNEGSSDQAVGQAGVPYGANSQYGANTPYGSATMNGPNGNVSPTGVNDTSPRGQTGGAGTTTSMNGANGAVNNSTDASTLNDAQFTAAIQAANDGEIRAAELAMDKAHSPDVKRFAQHMLNDHREMQKKTGALVSRLQITPADNGMATEIHTDAQNELLNLQNASASDFDRLYVDAQVKDHNRVLELIDRASPNMKSSDLKSAVTADRAKVADHLRMAERLQRTLRQEQGTTDTMPKHGTQQHQHPQPDQPQQQPDPQQRPSGSGTP